MSAPTLKELIGKANRAAVYPDYKETISAREELTARCNPATMAKVLHVLEVLHDMIPSPEVKEALTLLNGETK